jgi:ASC-1-like (ASCH) protein
MCDCSDYPPTFYERKIVNGRKEHRCSECLRTIKKGEQHEYAKGLWEGDFSQFRTCQTCRAMVEEIGLECYCHGNLMDEVDERDHHDTQSVADFFERRRANYDRIYAAKRLAVNA